MEIDGSKLLWNLEGYSVIIPASGRRPLALVPEQTWLYDHRVSITVKTG